MRHGLWFERESEVHIQEECRLRHYFLWFSLYNYDISLDGNNCCDNDSFLCVALMLNNIMNIHFHICSFLRHLGEKAHKFSSNKNRKMRSRCLSDLFSPPRNSLCIFGSNNVREITRKKQHKTDCCAHRS